MVSKTAVRRSVPSGELPAFTPVPRRIVRHDGWTVARQIAFIQALADTGCVKIAARMVNMSAESAYMLRRQPGAESFRAAWDAAQTLGLQVCKDEAFDRAMNGQLIPVFVAGKLMGFRRKKNDGLLMFILRHYGQDSQGRKTTVNYFSTRASAGAATEKSSPAFAGEGDRAQRGGGASSLAAAEASTTTVKTVISASGAPRNQLAADDTAANVLNAFEGVALDAEAQAEIRRTLEACAERRRALEDDPENDPDRFFIGEAETAGYLGELESGVEGDWVEYKPDGEYRWEGLGEGGEAERIDAMLEEMKRAREAGPGDPPTAQPEAPAALPAPDAAPSPDPLGEPLQRVEAPDPPVLSEVEGDDPRLDWRNWTDGGYVAPENPPRNGEGDHPQGGGGVDPAPISPRTGKPLKPYKKRTPKPAFTPPDEVRKAEAVVAVEAERRELAAAEAERRKRRDSGDSYS